MKTSANIEQPVEFWSEATALHLNLLQNQQLDRVPARDNLSELSVARVIKICFVLSPSVFSSYRIRVNMRQKRQIAVFLVFQHPFHATEIEYNQIRRPLKCALFTPIYGSLKTPVGPLRRISARTVPARAR